MKRGDLIMENEKLINIIDKLSHDKLSIDDAISELLETENSNNKDKENNQETNLTQDYLKNMFEKRLNLNGEMTPQTSFVTVGLDSIGASDIVTQINDNFKTNFAPTILFECDTIEKLMHFLKKNVVGLPDDKESKPAPQSLNLNDYLRDLFKKRLKIDEDISAQKSFVDLGLDSIGAADIIDQINNKFQANYAPTVLFECDTIEKLSDFLRPQSVVNKVDIQTATDDLDLESLGNDNENTPALAKTIEIDIQASADDLDLESLFSENENTPVLVENIEIDIQAPADDLDLESLLDEELQQIDAHSPAASKDKVLDMNALWEEALKESQAPETRQTPRSISLEQLFNTMSDKVFDIDNTDYQSRMTKIRHLSDVIKKYADKIFSALKQDKKATESECKLEFNNTLEVLAYTCKHLEEWMKPQNITQNLALAYFQYKPRGTVLIITPANLAFSLTFMTLSSAVAAGNVAMLKPDSRAKHVAEVISDIVKEAFPENEVSCVIGDAEVGKTLLSFPFNHIAFIGSSEAGKEITKIAATHFTSVTLECGGKNPCILDEDYDLNHFMQEYIPNKLLTCGQLCIAPDYILVPKSRQSQLLDLLKTSIANYIGNDIEEQLQSDNYSRIVHKDQFNKLRMLHEKALSEHCQCVYGGGFSEEELFIQPSIYTNVGPDSILMKEEIYGPLIVVIPYNNVTELLAGINKIPRPLAMYLFSQKKSFIDSILSHSHAGGVSINGIAIHPRILTLPFGGVNQSGNGYLHGFFGFESMSYKQALAIGGHLKPH